MRRRERGMTLIELVVAILVLSLGSLAALRAADQSALAITGAQERLLAQIAVLNRAEELRILGAAAGSLPGTVEQGGQRFTLGQTQEATAGGLMKTTLTARGPGGAGALLVVYLPGSSF